MKIKRKQNYKEKRKKIKRQISIFTIMLWIVIISTMIWVTVNNTKKTNALEVEDKNWNISLVMYDRSSDTPNNAITEFTWNAVNSREEKQLCMQINYACTTNKEYQPGEIEITIPGLGNSGSEYNKSYYPNATIAADEVSDANRKYDWSYSYDIENNIYTFTNNMTIEENEHFEGSIQIVYNLLPEFRIKTDLEFKAKIKENIENAEELIAMESNVCNFHYTSTKVTYTLEKIGSAAPRKDYTKIENILDDYYWVRYEFKYNNGRNGVIIALNKEIRDILPEGCVMYDNKLNKLEPMENNGYYRLENYVDNYYYVGYPKSKYKEGDKITNIAEFWGRYEDEEDMQKLAEASTATSLTKFDFEYKGDIYGISKKLESSSIMISDIKDKGTNIQWNLLPIAFYTDSLMDVEVGDDLLYITREDGDVTKLEDSEYNFTEIDVPVFKTYNKYSGYGGEALIGYNYELQVRYKDTNEYVVYSQEITTDKTVYYNIQKKVVFDRNDIVGVKLVIKDLDKTLYSGDIKVKIRVNTQDCATGDLYNFDYLQAYKKDNEGNKILDNEPKLDNYNTQSTKLKVAEYDIATYGTYMQRGYANVKINDGSRRLSVTKRLMRGVYNNVKEERYETTYNVYSGINLKNMNLEDGCVIRIYDILPSGMNFIKIEDLDLNYDFPYKNIKLKDGTEFNTFEEFSEFLSKNTSIDIDYNYKNSGRTKISITFNLNEVDWSYYLNHILIGNYWGSSGDTDSATIGVDISVEIPYDSIIEYGTSYKNYAYAMWNYSNYNDNYNDYYKDNGEYDSLASDIDEDGNIEEKAAISKYNIDITHAVSSKQAVIKQVRTDLTERRFVVDTAEVIPGNEYTYKLRVTTGANSLKDLIIYDNIETVLDENGNDISNGWKGEFLGVDTEYAKSKGYAPVVYYSEEINPGKLTEVPEKWIELTDIADKSKVKSICVDLRYKEDGTEMELSSNNVVFVLVNMKAPNDKSLAVSSNNMFSTNWRVKDPLGTVIDNVEGIYSNQVNVGMVREKKNISGEKIWQDSDNKYNLRPNKIKIKLLRDGEEYMEKEVTKNNDWKYTFENVIVSKYNGEEYKYEIVEESVPNYKTTYDGYNVINTLMGKNITGTKTWEYNWLESDRPNKITVKLLQDGIEYMRKEVKEEDNWRYTFENVPVYKNDKLEEYEYSIEEEELPEYNATYDEYNINNALKTKEIEVKKVWNDKDNEHGIRPKFVLVKVYDGEKWIYETYLREENDWKDTFELPEYRADGSKIEYRVDEEVEEYREEYLGGGTWDYENNFEHEGDFELYNQHYIKQINGTTITNKYVEPNERIKIIGAKVWEDNNDIAGKRPGSIVLQIKNGEEVISEGVVTKENNWSYEFEVPKYDEEGNEISYHIDEKETPKFYQKELTNETTVTNKFVVPDEKVKIPVIKLWEDLEDKYSKRPNSVTLQVYNGEKLVAESKVDEKNNWRYKFELPKYDEIGNEIEYTVNEKEDNKYYEKRISGYTVINKCIYESVADTSDINIFVYVVIFFIAIIGVIVGIIFVRKSK